MDTRSLRAMVLAVLPILALGCQTFQPALNLSSLGKGTTEETNPIWVTLPPSDYTRVFETALSILSDHGFEVAEANRYSGHIEAVPRIAPGVVLSFKPGSPDIYERFLASAQTYRHRVTIRIQTADPAPADHGGYFVEFIVRKELEDLAKPAKSTVGNAVFRTENTLARQTEVIDAEMQDPAWIFRGRDRAMEQDMIRRFNAALRR